ncbi:DNA primase [Candidatus Woesearchaeota archaeon]|nr:DNA primase [Candidatus Woesearchaeota archaeon]
MGKISPVSAKYIVHSTIEIDGVVDKPDVIGAIFGQTEGLLGADLELRELQRSGRIGRIEVNVDTKTGKTKGEIIVPSSLDKAETAIIAAAFEIIQRIGPCNAKIKVIKIEDVRISKRNFVVTRAKELLREMIDSVMPDSQELADEVSYSVRVMEVGEYGNDRLPAGPAIDESEEIILVEGRADVLTLLKHGIKNAIAMNGTSASQTIIDLCKKKEVTVFVDGDRGGVLNIKELLQVASIDFVTRAPDGKEVEELTKKEIHQALRAKVSAEQIQDELEHAKQLPHQPPQRGFNQQPQGGPQYGRQLRPGMSSRGPPGVAMQQAPPARQQRTALSTPERDKFKGMLDDLVGTRGAFILDNKLNILGKVPLSELVPTVNSLGTGVYAVIFDGSVDKDILQTAEKSRVRYLIGMDSSIRPGASSVQILTAEQLA